MTGASKNLRERPARLKRPPLTERQRFNQAFRVALEVLQLERDSEPADPKHECEMTIGPDVWRRMVALARQAETGKRGPRTPGICRRCGCTWLAACEGGCSWVDDSMSICSHCIDAVGEEKPDVP